MAHPKHRISQTRQAKRRTHYKIEAPNVSTCPTTGQPHLFHHAYYRGRVLWEKEGAEA
jgi:large subunit ribosomal protein L32